MDLFLPVSQHNPRVRFVYCPRLYLSALVPVLCFFFFFSSHHTFFVFILRSFLDFISTSAFFNHQVSPHHNVRSQHILFKHIFNMQFVSKLSSSVMTASLVHTMTTIASPDFPNNAINDGPLATPAGMVVDIAEGPAGFDSGLAGFSACRQVNDVSANTHSSTKESTIYILFWLLVF